MGRSEEKEVSSDEACSLSIGPNTGRTRLQRLTALLKTWGVETHGITPVPLDKRTEKRLYQLFVLWFSNMLSVPTFAAGSIGPAFFSLGIRDSLFIVLGGNLVAVFGPTLGMRAMVQARFSWGYYGAVIPSILNTITLLGYIIISTIAGGQTLAAVSVHLDDTIGIVVISAISLVVCFMGYRAIHLYESVAWLPNLLAFLVMLGVGSKHLVFPSAPPAESAAIVSFLSIICANTITLSPMTPDFGVHHAPAASWKIFLYVYLGCLCASLPGEMLGVVFAASAPAVPAWKAGFDVGNNVGGLFAAVLAMSGGFGKFLTVVVALTIPSGVAPTMYSFGTSFMAITPLFAKIPRYAYALVSTAILLPIAIIGSRRFYNVLVDIISIAGYWCSSFSAIVITDHAIIRRGRWETYISDDWNNPRRLPLGAAALIAFVGSMGIVVPCMSQVWYTGPIAASGTGDIAVYMAFVTAALLYVPLRLVEKKVERRMGRNVQRY
ncbi:cytosine-purine permease [Artomyces pyxidatus]|uniref:Cytosine-purine permease n=1 Tax=Artomyces pyxidatus TaxID=48021 RepID=A0ACB8T396_9AGAM|nr:cytosine-purine permease [Artomyces pyxidatus]